MVHPTMIQVETSTACDAKCIFCPRPDMKRAGGIMKEKVFDNILHEAVDIGISEILLFLNGEPLMCALLPVYLEKLRRAHMTTAIFTNANDLIMRKAQLLISYSDVIRSITFSIVGIDKKTHKELMGLDYEKVSKNVHRFCKLNDGKIKTIATMPIFSKTAHLQARWEAEWHKVVDYVAGTSMFNFAGLVHDELEHKEDERHQRAPCGRLYHVVILWDGRVCLCCMDVEGQVILGDVREQSLLEIFNGETTRYYREFHSQGRYDELELCRDCNMNIVLKE